MRSDRAPRQRLQLLRVPKPAEERGPGPGEPQTPAGLPQSPGAFLCIPDADRERVRQAPNAAELPPLPRGGVSPTRWVY